MLGGGFRGLGGPGFRISVFRVEGSSVGICWCLKGASWDSPPYTNSPLNGMAIRGYDKGY